MSSTTSRKDPPATDERARPSARRVSSVGAARGVRRAVALAGVTAGVVIYEHRVLARLDATPDPDADDGFTVPADRVHAIPTLGGGSLHAEECGSGRPVVLLHGHGSHVAGARAIGSTSPAARRQGLTRRLLGVDLTDRLGDVRVPVLVLAGAADRVVPPSESERVCTSLPGARLEEFAGAGHMLPVERSARVADGEPCQLVT